METIFIAIQDYDGKAVSFGELLETFLQPKAGAEERCLPPGTWSWTTPFIYRLDVQAALQRGLYFVIIVDSLFLIPDSLRQSLSSLLLHHSARFPRPSARFVLPSARFLIPDSYLPPPHIAQGALRRALCYISCLPPPDSCSLPPDSYVPPCASYVPRRASELPALASWLSPLESYLHPPASYLLPPASFLPPPAS